MLFLPFAQSITFSVNGLWPARTYYYGSGNELKCVGVQSKKDSSLMFTS